MRIYTKRYADGKQKRGPARQVKRNGELVWIGGPTPRNPKKRVIPPAPSKHAKKRKERR